MTIPATGAISMSQIQAEHGGSGSISLGEYYRDGSYVGNDPWNDSVPTAETISMGQLRGTTKTRYLTVIIQGAGGAGGQGEADNWVSDGHGAAGGGSTFTAYNGTHTDTVVSVAGGAGGAGVVISYSTTSGRAGADSYYGAGGAGGGNNSHGTDAPTASYGAGGGGGGGDSPSTYDNSGYAGHGGYAGARGVHIIRAMKGSTITLVVGYGGARNSNVSAYGNNYIGGAGASGYGSVSGYGTSTGGTTSWTVV